VTLSHPVEERFQVGIHDPPKAFLHVPLRPPDRVVSLASARAGRTVKNGHPARGGRSRLSPRCCVSPESRAPARRLRRRFFRLEGVGVNPAAFQLLESSIADILLRRHFQEPRAVCQGLYPYFPGNAKLHDKAPGPLTKSLLGVENYGEGLQGPTDLPS
jgi:hypothetical protein